MKGINASLWGLRISGYALAVVSAVLVGALSHNSWVSFGSGVAIALIVYFIVGMLGEAA